MTRRPWPAPAKTQPREWWGVRRELERVLVLEKSRDRVLELELVSWCRAVLSAFASVLRCRLSSPLKLSSASGSCWNFPASSVSLHLSLIHPGHITVGR